ncbi:MAG: nucleotide sugar dehydrogenase [Alphaproteobacteria bacterium]
MTKTATMRTVCVQGLGFVGVAMAAAVADARDKRGAPYFQVIGLDLPTELGRQRIDAVNAGRFPFGATDASLPAAMRRAQEAGNLRATSDAAVIADCDVIVVDVPLDLVRPGEPEVDFTPFRNSIRTIGQHMRPSALVLTETTVPPGTSARLIAPELAAALRQRGFDANAFLLAYSYERVMPGRDYLNSIRQFWRVYAGHTPEAAEACADFLGKIIAVDRFPLTRLASTTAAETAKVLENSYRAANIAFIEEWGRFAEAAGVDLFEVINAIRVRPTHSNLRQPGFGVGGYCLTKDPLFAMAGARQLLSLDGLDFPFCRAAVAANAIMPMTALRMTEQKLGGSIAKRRLLLLGVTYREDVEDTRHSPSLFFYEQCLSRGALVTCHDPLVRHWQEANLDLAERIPDPNHFDAVIFAVRHPQYRTLSMKRWLNGARPAVIDANAVLTPEQCRALAELGCPHASVGRGDT